MTTAAPSPGRPSWTAAGTLYALLMDSLPDHHTESGILDVDKLSTDLGKSHEAVYKWLRRGFPGGVAAPTPSDPNRRVPALEAKNARALFNLANGESNVAALRRLKKKPPEIRSFDPFVYVG